MLSIRKLYRPVIVGSVAVGIVIASVGLVLFARELMASANNSVHSILKGSEIIANAQNPAQSPSIEALEATVYRDPSCSCCRAWMEHLRSNGFQVSEVQQPNMDDVKQEYNVPDSLRSCHTAIINGTVVEGHVPAEAIKRFLSAESDALGLAVPGMPVGSPGMEAGETQEPFTVFSFDQQGNTKVFNRYTS